MTLEIVTREMLERDADKEFELEERIQAAIMHGEVIDDVPTYEM